MKIDDLVISSASTAVVIWKRHGSVPHSPWDYQFNTAMGKLDHALHVEPTDVNVLECIRDVQEVYDNEPSGAAMYLLGMKVADAVSRMFEHLEYKETDDIEMLRSRIAQLEEAAAPFRAIARNIPKDVSDNVTVEVSMNRMLSHKMLAEIESMNGIRPNSQAKLVLAVDGLNVGHFRAIEETAPEELVQDTAPTPAV